MRVLILTTQYLPHLGGSELAIKNLTERLPQVHFDIVSSGFGGKWLLPLTGFLQGLRRRYDVIHVFQASYAGGAGWLLKLFFPRVPLVVTLQEGKDLSRQHGWIRFFRWLILRKADVITAISTYLREYARGINPRAKHVLLPNGVSLPPHFPVVAKKTMTITTSSRLVHKNGIDILIRALALLPECRLEIIGDGPLRDVLQELAQSLGIAHRVTFRGMIPYERLPDYLASASVFVRPSRSEGQGIAFLDAMVAGVPVVAPPVGGITDFLRDGETGLFCKPEDPRSVADAIRRLLTDEPLREKIVKQAYQMVRERYNWDTLAQQYYEIISHYSRI